MNDDTRLFRQINPSWVQNGRVTSQAFRPTPKDKRRLSVYDGGQITAEQSWVHFTKSMRHACVGVLAVTVEECHQQAVAVEPDPEPFPEHVVMIFGADLSNSQIEKKAKRLRHVAEHRGWQFEADTET